MKYNVMERKITLFYLVKQKDYKADSGGVRGTVELNTVEALWTKTNLEAFLNTQTFIAIRMK